MKDELLNALNDEELKIYASAVGCDVKKGDSKGQIIEKIKGHRERLATVEVMGLTLAIPYKRLQDKRVIDLFNQDYIDETEACECIHGMLGDEQWDRCIELITDEDGTIDYAGLTVIASKIFSVKLVKN